MKIKGHKELYHEMRHFVVCCCLVARLSLTPL